MIRTRRVVAAAVALTVAATLVVSGCGLQTGSVYVANIQPNSIRPDPALRGVQLTVGSKDFSEVLILGYVAIIAMKAAGAQIVDRTGIKGSQGQRQALLAGGIDLGWDYTGSGWISYLGNTEPIPDSEAQFQAVKKQDAGNGIVWVDRAPMNNTYALAVTAANARKYGLRTTSDAARLMKAQPDLASICIETEFSSRDDGLPGLSKKYGFSIPTSQVQVMELGLIYTRTAASTCTFGEVYTTDGRIGANNLVVLEDDRKFFPIYNIAMTVRGDIFAKYPGIERVFAPISARLTTAEISRLNARVDINGDEPAKVALDWMVQQGFVRSPDAGANSRT